MSVKHGDLTNKLSDMKSENAAGADVLDDLKSVAGNCERPKTRAKVAGQCEEPSTTALTAAFLVQLAEWVDYKNFYEASTIENQCIHGRAADVKESPKKLANRKKANAASKTAPKSRERIVLLLPINEWLH